MESDHLPVPTTDPDSPGGPLPALVAAAGGSASFAYREFFDATIDNPHTLRAYRHAVNRFLAWAQGRGLSLQAIRPGDVANYLRTQLIKKNGEPVSKPTQKLHLAALRNFFDRLVTRHAVLLNPAGSVRGPRYVTEGKTPAFTPDQVRQVLNAIDVSNIVGLRDRAIIAALVYTGARGGAVAGLRLKDRYHDGRQFFLHFDEKGGKEREIPVRHDLEGFLTEYVRAAGITGDDGDRPLFRTTVRRTKQLTPDGVTGNDVYRMVKRRLRAAGLPADRFTCHSYRATTATDLLEQGVGLEDVQFLLGHSDPRTTRLYDKRGKEITRNIVEKISI
jgi:site-specific recombinase XerD